MHNIIKKDPGYQTNIKRLSFATSIQVVIMAVIVVGGSALSVVVVVVAAVAIAVALVDQYY